MRIGKNKVIIKIPMLILVLAIVTAAIVIPIVSRPTAPVAPSFGYVNPQMWKFETRAGAVATATSGALTNNGQDVAVMNSDTGVRVQVQQTGKGADSVCLRNALNLDLNPERKPLRLAFEARSGEGSTNDFPITFTLRDGASLMWSERFSVGSSWKEYEQTIPVKQSGFLNVIMAVHLAEAPGSVEIRNIHVVNADSPKTQTTAAL